MAVCTGSPYIGILANCKMLYIADDQTTQFNSPVFLFYIFTCTIIIDGYEFFCSANNVILCAGNAEGILPTKYFDQVTDHQTGKTAIFDIHTIKK